jgi:cell division protein FtsZ
MVPEDDEALAAWAAYGQGHTVAIVGLGGAGGEAVRDLLALGLPDVPGVAVNTDAPHLLKLPVHERILVGQRQFRGYGSGGDRLGALAGAEEAREELLRRLRRYQIVFLFAGLGGGTGSALLPFLVEELRDTPTLAIPVAFLPFHVELDSNPERRSNTLDALRELEEVGGLLLALSNEKLRRFEALSMAHVLHLRNTYLHRLVGGLVDMIEHPSQMNVDLASLKWHLKDSGVSTLLLSEEHVSEPERLVHQALNDSLLDFELSESPSALVHVDGGSNLTLRTVDRVWRAMRRRLGEPRRMLVGTRTHPEPREVVRLTAVVGGLKPRSVRDALGPTAGLAGL